MARREGVAGEATARAAVASSGQSLPAEAVAIASHDLKNFATTVTSLLAEGRHTEEDRAQLLQIAQRATSRMEELIGDLLDNARIEARRPPTVTSRAMDVAALVREVCEAFAVQAARESKIIDFDVVGELPFAQADVERLHQVLTNLVGNAMKSSPAGGRVRVVAERAGAEIRLSVTETGPGIPEDQVGHVVDPLKQAPNRARLGSGLGLEIAKGIVEAYGGTIGVVGAGTFFFTVPLAEDNGEANDRGKGRAF